MLYRDTGKWKLQYYHRVYIGVIIALKVDRVHYWGFIEIMKKKMGTTIWGLGIEYGVYGDLIIIYPQPYSIYLRGTIKLRIEVGQLLAQVVISSLASVTCKYPRTSK